jgi:2-polyprenyl-6-hydroxyphenyl methylase/3-demethylubiquinone-9 3-methyltransferase
MDWRLALNRRPRETLAMTTTIDAREAAHFGALADDWWNPKGSSAPLHKVNPVRLGFIRDKALRHFRRSPTERQWLAGLDVLDIGCGGGILAECLARLGGRVTGIDAAPEAIAAAAAHARQGGLAIDYRHASVELLAAAGQRFDLVTCMEVIEHVADVELFVRNIHALTKPGGLFVFSTPNRTAKSYAAMIIAAEWLFRLIPRGTHDWSKFLTPEELSEQLRAAGFVVGDIEGIALRPGHGFVRADDRSVNYIGMAVPQPVASTDAAAAL